MVEGRGVVGVQEEDVGAAKVFEEAISMVGGSFYHSKEWSERSRKAIAHDGKIQTSAYFY